MLFLSSQVAAGAASDWSPEAKGFSNWVAPDGMSPRLHRQSSPASRRKGRVVDDQLHDRSFAGLTYEANATAFASAAEQGHCVKDAASRLPAHYSTPCHRFMSALVARNGITRTPRNHSSPIDGVVVVHYSRAVCRKQRFVQRLEALGLPSSGPRLHWAEHLDGPQALTLGIVRRCVACSLLIRGRPVRFQSVELTQASCTLNHIYAYHVALAAGWRRALVLEDDAGLPDDFLSRLTTQLAALPRSWSVYNFGCPLRSTPSPLHGGSLVCSRGYVLSRSGIHAFVRHAGVADNGADWMVHKLSATTESRTATNTWHSGIPVRELSVQGGKKLPRLRADDRCDDMPRMRTAIKPTLEARSADLALEVSKSAAPVLAELKRINDSFAGKLELIDQRLLAIEKKTSSIVS